MENWRTNHGNKFVDPNRRDYVRPDCKPRIKRPAWHGLRHLYFQENRRHLIAEGGMTERRAENEISERMGTTATMSKVLFRVFERFVREEEISGQRG